MSDLKGLPGFRDFYPEDLAVRAHIFAVWRDVARRYAFEEYDGPPIEPLELYTRKSGAEIVEQLYQFEDKGGRQVALRPEMTPTLARMAAARARALPKPVRWYSIPQLFRYERQQRGRLREHFQLNLDILGETDVLADAELLAAALDIVLQLGLDSSRVRARVSDRRLLGAAFRSAGVPEPKLLEVYQAVDHLDREPRDRLEERLGKLGLEHETIGDIFQIVETEDVSELVGQLGSSKELQTCVEELQTYREHLDDLGFGDYLDFDLSVVRGLAYYTGIVFELWDARRELRAICGGGRYDDLLSDLTNIDLPALGFGMGDVVLTELLRDHDELPTYRRGVDCFVVMLGDAARRQGLRAAAELRAAGHSVAYDFRERSVARQFKSADQIDARLTIVLGPEELERREAIVRDMRSGEQESVRLSELVPEVGKRDDDV